MNKENFEINKGKYLKVCFPKYVNFETFSKCMEETLIHSKELQRLPIILNLEDNFLHFSVLDVVKLVNNSPIINTPDAKLTDLAIVYHGKIHNELVEMLEISLKNIGFIRVEKFSDLIQASNWIDKE